MSEAADKAGQKMGAAADKAGEKMDQQSAKAGVAIEDTEITAKVKAAIFAEPGLRTLQISVDTVKGVVTLTGSVDSAASGERAKSLAGAVAGVKEVDNKLVAMPAK
jgi:osmotically-inducible protein OsmY